MTWYRDGVPVSGGIGLAQFFHAVDTGYHCNVLPDSVYFNRRFEVVTTRMVGPWKIDFKIIDPEVGELRVGDYHERYRLNNDFELRWCMLRALDWIEQQTRSACDAARRLISESRTPEERRKDEALRYGRWEVENRMRRAMLYGNPDPASNNKHPASGIGEGSK